MARALYETTLPLCRATCAAHTLRYAKLIKDALLDHNPATTAHFFTGLEDQSNAAFKIAVNVQIAGRPQQHWVSPSCPQVCMMPGVLDYHASACFFRNRQGVHIRAHPDCWPIALTLNNRADSGLSEASVNLRDPKHLEALHNKIRGRMTGQIQFGMLMQVPPPLGHLACVAGNLRVNPDHEGENRKDRQDMPPSSFAASELPTSRTS